MENQNVQTILDYCTNRNESKVLAFKQFYNNVVNHEQNYQVSQFISPNESNLSFLFRTDTDTYHNDVFQLSYTELNDTMQVMTNVVTGYRHLNHPILADYFQQLRYQNTTLTIWIKDMPAYDQVSHEVLKRTYDVLTLFTTVPINYVFETPFEQSLNQTDFKVDQVYQVETATDKIPDKIDKILTYDFKISNDLYQTLKSTVNAD